MKTFKGRENTMPIKNMAFLYSAFFPLPAFPNWEEAPVQILVFACQVVMKTTTLCVTFSEQSWAQGMSLVVCPAQEPSLLTFFPCGEVLLDGVIEPDPKRGRAYLSLEAGRQPAVEFHWSFCFHQSGDCSQNAFILRGSGGRAFTLDLEMRKVQVRGK